MAKKKPGPYDCPYCTAKYQESLAYCTNPKCRRYIAPVSIVRQTKAKRPAPLHMLMDDERLPLIKTYTYDCANDEFLTYARSRWPMAGVFEPGSLFEWWVYNHEHDKNEFMDGTDLMARQDGTPFTQEEASSRWECILFGRAHLQDLWEIWTVSVKGGGNG